MKNKKASQAVLTIVLLAVFSVIAQSAYGAPGPGAGTRTLEVVYTVELDALPDGAAEARVWIPMPVDGRDQRILGMEVNSPAAYTVSYDPEWGNRIIYFEPRPEKGGFTFRMKFTVERSEASADLGRVSAASVDRGLFSKYLAPSTYAVHNDAVERLSRTAAGGKTGPVERARAVYDFILENMQYSKGRPGWGRGDVERICLAIGGGEKAGGNCTDFHSFFASLLHYQDVPVVFEMGFPFDPEGGATVEGGYHCWARFFLPGAGWVPVDISAAAKAPQERDYYFGSIDENRVVFSRGRDVLLTPPQMGERLNFFGPDPYIEVDGRPFAGFTRRITYRDAGG